MKENKNNCPGCLKEPAKTHPQYGLLKGEKCLVRDRKISSGLTPPPEFATLSMADRIIDQRLRNEKDIIQPWTDGEHINPEFVKAYPDLARDYFTQEQLEKL